MRVLLIDDYQPFLSALYNFLCKEPNIQVVGQALNGNEGLKLAAELNPDLVLVDFSMYGTNGIDVTRKLKASKNPPRVIMVSLHTAQEYRDKALQAGADDYVVKTDIFKHLMPLIMRPSNRPVHHGDLAH
jgi:DNA-binding NarL/FixJ family response regulator